MGKVNNLYGEKVFLRALEFTDLDFLFKVENNESLWEVSHTIAPYSKYVLSKYLENAHLDIYEAKQLRLVICKIDTEEAIGFIDLFDFDPFHSRVGIGIVIDEPKDRQQGFATDALQIAAKYAFRYLKIHQLFATITEDNVASIQLFEKNGFQMFGRKKDWLYSNGIYKDELIYQLIDYVY